MKKAYPIYQRGELIKIYESLPKTDRTVLDQFLTECETSAKKLKVDNMRRELTQFLNIVETNLKDLKNEEVTAYLTLLNNSNREKWGVLDARTFLKRFIRWHYKDYSARFPVIDKRQARNSSKFNEKKINSTNILKVQDIEKLMKTETRLYWKTFFITLYESGMRPCELLNLKWGDIELNYNGDLSRIPIYATKTKRHRTTWVKEATFFLSKLKEEYKNTGILAETDRIFYSKYKDHTKPMSKGTISTWLHDLGKRAIGREIYPYILRHSRATQLYFMAKKGLISTEAVTEFMGHSKDMSGVYTHLSDEQAEEITKSIYEFEELPEEKKQELENKIEEQDKIIAALSSGFEDYKKEVNNYLTIMREQQLKAYDEMPDSEKKSIPDNIKASITQAKEKYLSNRR